MEVNGSDIDTVELLEYWRMSNAVHANRRKRMSWAAEQYSAVHCATPSIRAYLALDRILPRG